MVVVVMWMVKKSVRSVRKNIFVDTHSGVCTGTSATEQHSLNAHTHSYVKEVFETAWELMY